MTPDQAGAFARRLRHLGALFLRVQGGHVPGIERILISDQGIYMDGAGKHRPTIYLAADDPAWMILSSGLIAWPRKRNPPGSYPPGGPAQEPEGPAGTSRQSKHTRAPSR